MTIYYDSRTGNVQRFTLKLKKVFEANGVIVNFIKIDKDMIVQEDGHLITFTTGFGEVSETTQSFLSNSQNDAHILSVSSSGNMNWGELYAKAAHIISERLHIPIVLKFELSGTLNDAQNYFQNVIDFENVA